MKNCPICGMELEGAILRAKGELIAGQICTNHIPSLSFHDESFDREWWKKQIKNNRIITKKYTKQYLSFIKNKSLLEF
jgi:hypothetical protein